MFIVTGMHAYSIFLYTKRYRKLFLDLISMCGLYWERLPLFCFGKFAGLTFSSVQERAAKEL